MMGLSVRPIGRVTSERTDRWTTAVTASSPPSRWTPNTSAWRRCQLGFPAAGGTRDAFVVRYVLIGQQQTMLGEPNGATTSRTRHLKTMLQDAGFPTTITANMDGWLLGHAAFVVPIACALDPHVQPSRTTRHLRRQVRPPRSRSLSGQCPHIGLLASADCWR